MDSAEIIAPPPHENRRAYCFCKALMYPHESTADAPMVGCDGCDDFFHVKCLGLKKLPKSRKWFCRNCTEGKKQRRKNLKCGASGSETPTVDVKEDQPSVPVPLMSTPYILEESVTSPKKVEKRLAPETSISNSTWSKRTKFQLPPDVLCHTCKESIPPQRKFTCTVCGAVYHLACQNKKKTCEEELCKSCCCTNNKFSYERCLQRLRLAYLDSRSILIRQVEKEQCYIRSYDSPLCHSERSCSVNDLKDVATDATALALLRRSGGEHRRLRPLVSSPNGNCLYNSVSTFFHGHEGFATQLRCKVVIELCQQEQYYTKELTKYGNLDDASVSDIINRATTNHEDAGIGEISALASVMRQDFRLVISLDNVLQTLTVTARTTDYSQQLLLLWTRADENSILPNHLVPLTTVARDGSGRKRRWNDSVDLDADSSGSEEIGRMSIEEDKEQSRDHGPQSPKKPSEPTSMCASACEEQDGRAFEEEECDGQQAKAEFKSYQQLIDFVKSEPSSMGVPNFPESSSTLKIDASTSSMDGWRWRNDGSKCLYVGSDGGRIHKEKQFFFRKSRIPGSNRRKDEKIRETEEVHLIRLSNYSHHSNNEFRKRVTSIRKIMPHDEETCLVIEYVRPECDDAILSNPPHGNSKRGTSCPPTDRSALGKARRRVQLGQKTRRIFREVQNLNNRQQVYNLVRKEKAPQINPCSCDPWHDAISQHFKERAVGGQEYVRAVYVEEGNIAIVCYEKLANVKMVMVDNPAHVDTTYSNGAGAYVTYLGFANLRLMRRSDGEHPFFFGPALVHTKEKDSKCIQHFLTHIRMNSEMEPYFVTDEDAMLRKAAREVWPDARQSLGREHLIAQFTRRAREHNVAPSTIATLKKDVFGPGVSQSLMDSKTPKEFEDTLLQLRNKWDKLEENAQNFAKWLMDNKMNVYRHETTGETKSKLGIPQAWQQSQERMNAELKAERSTLGVRNLTNVLAEIRQIISNQRSDEILALRNSGEYEVIPQLQGYCVDGATWQQMTPDEREGLFREYTCAPIKSRRSLVNITTSIEDKGKGRKAGKILGRPVPTAPLPSTSETNETNETVRENDEDFHLTVNDRKRKCAYCRNDILSKTTLVKDKLMISHNERYVYPLTKKADGRTWDKTALSRHDTRPHHYHASALCIYGRFRRTYFDNMKLNIHAAARPHVESLTFFTHPELREQL